MTKMKDYVYVLLLVSGVFMYACVKADTEISHKLIMAGRENMTDTGENFIEYECTAEVDEFDRLSWYQARWQSESHVLLNMTQRRISGKGSLTVTLHKTLEDTDKDSEVYCTKENWRKQQAQHSEVLKWIYLAFTRDVGKLEEATVSIYPNSKEVYFDTEKTLTFVCKGSAPIDGRSLTWYLETYETTTPSNDIYITPKFEIAQSQTYDLAKNENVLKLHLKKSYHLKRVFCAQDLRTDVIEDGREGVVRYGQRAKSETITFILRNGINTSTNTDPAPIWPTALVSTVALVLFVALVIVVIKYRNRVADFEEKERLWARGPIQTPNENQYETVYGHGAGLMRRPKK